MPAAPCPLCGAKKPEFIRAVVNRDPASEALFPKFSISGCKACGLLHQNPRISCAAMTKAYAALEDKTGGGVTRAESESRLKALKQLKAPPARLLEVGSSDGTFLALAAQAGYRAVGVEPSRVNLAKARAAHPGLEFHEGFLESFKTRERFDLICHFYVLGYSFEPRRFLAAARKLLAPGGQMLLEVPDAARFAALPFAASLFTHQDISIFTRGTLNALLSREGFSPLSKKLGTASKSYGLRASAATGRVAVAPAKNKGEGLNAMRRYFKNHDRILAKLERRVAGWLPAIANRPGPVVVFGAGENGRVVGATKLGKNGHELVFCDNNAALHGQLVDGRRVLSPAQVPALSPALVIAASSDYQDDMVRQMKSLGVPEERLVKLYENF
jgi:SAM-dependent methyltransferase